MDRFNKWIDGLFDRANLDSTVSALVASQDDENAGTKDRAAVKKRLADAEGKLRRFQDAIAAGVDPTALVDAINKAQEQHAAAQAELNGTPRRTGRSAAEVYAMIDSLGDVPTAAPHSI
ncbi:hypothetical protein FKR81_23235 [Lentzea tibetensis]|uniref:Uncharacterized protein n=1 Tax=Lentzea tibetensis TaxID=2591470 RepID=A0A563EPZ1_9PSEU|nr:hypothetical protein [Lentzea tibetensis]TWP49467.1 hypothetical protein FKR81_23235 [Lentzea tibetensis]